MKQIIVTVRNESGDYAYDMEIPVDLEAEKLLDDIVQTLNGCDPSLYLQTGHYELFCERKGQALDGERTAEEAGVRNGDFIVLRRKG